MATEGWLGRAIEELDPHKENVLTAVNFGRGLPRALAMPGVSVASVGSLETYGVLTGIEGEDQRSQALDIFARMYSPMIGSGMANEYLSQTGLDALKGADILSTAPQGVFLSCGIQRRPILAVGQEHCPGPPGRFRDPYPVHRAQPRRIRYPRQPVDRFPQALVRCVQRGQRLLPGPQEHNANEEVVILMFTEFGRRVQENGSGTDHGSGSVAFVMGDAVKGGLYGEYPSLERDKLDEGDLQWNNDFRSTYSTLLDRWMGLDAQEILKGPFEQFDFIK